MTLLVSMAMAGSLFLSIILVITQSFIASRDWCRHETLHSTNTIKRLYQLHSANWYSAFSYG